MLLFAFWYVIIQKEQRYGSWRVFGELSVCSCKKRNSPQKTKVEKGKGWDKTIGGIVKMNAGDLLIINFGVFFAENDCERTPHRQSFALLGGWHILD